MKEAIAIHFIIVIFGFHQNPIVPALNSVIASLCTSAYGSNLWKLDSVEAEMMFSAWRTGIKLAWDVHRACRTYLLQQVLAPNITSLRVSLLSRFLGFFRGLLSSPSHEVAVVSRLAARDVRSSLGSNLALLQRETGLDPWVVGPGHLKQELQRVERVDVPECDSWRVTYLQKLLIQRLQAHFNGDQEEEERLKGLINSLVI